MLNETCTMRSTSQVIKADRERRKRNKKQADIFMLMREYICFFCGQPFHAPAFSLKTALFCFDDFEAVAHSCRFAQHNRCGAIFFGGHLYGAFNRAFL